MTTLSSPDQLTLSTQQPGDRPFAADFEVVPGPAVDAVLDSSADAVLDLVTEAYLRHGRGETVNPDSYFLRFPDKPEARIIALPSLLHRGEDTLVGLKWISSFPGNVRSGAPRASAVLVLNDYATGRPLALLEAASISAARTGASAAVAARALADTLDPGGTVGVVGAGVIARTVLRYLRAVGHPLDQVLVHDLDAASAGRLVDHVGQSLDVPAAPAGLADVLDADTVVTATTAATPYISSALRAGQIVLNVSLRDFAPEVVLAAQNVLDDVEHCLKAGTSPHLAEQAVGNRRFVDATIPELLQGEWTPSGDRPVLVSPFGLGVLDLAVAGHVLDRAREAGTLVKIPDFVGQVSRW